MRISLKSGSDIIPLAGEDGVSERVHTSAAVFMVEAVADKQIVRKVRGSHALVIDRGNLATSVRFETTRKFPTPAEAFLFCEDYNAGTPRKGELTIDTGGGGKRKLLSAVLDPPRLRAIGCAAFLAYVAHGTEIKPAEPEFIIETGDIESLMHRIVTAGSGASAEKWFECGFNSPFLLPGNAADGWTDPGGNLLFRIHRSEDLVTWDHDLIEAPGSPVANGDGSYTYWARSIYPIDSATKTGQLVCESTASNGNVNNNPFQSVIVSGVTLSLPNAPYTMPGDASQFQTDLAAIYPGATVTASSATVWRVEIPNVSSTAFGTSNKITWTQYAAGTDPFGGVVYSSGRDFTGQFVNAAGVRTNVQKQFARLGVSAGPNYQY